MNFTPSHGLNHCQFCEFLTERKLSIPTQHIAHFNSSIQVLLQHFQLRVDAEIFLERNALNHYNQKINSIKLVFAANLVFHNEFNIKLQGQTVFRCETYTIVKLFQQLKHCFASQAISSYFMHCMFS